MKTWVWVIAMVGLLVGIGRGADYYIGRDGTEYAPGYQPADSYLVHHPNTAPQPPPASRPISTPFRTTVPLRHEGEGMDVGLYGGGDLFQDGKFTLDGVGQADSKSRLGGVVGLKTGYTWSDFGAIAGNSSPTPSVVMPALYFDLFLTGVNYHAADNAGSSFSADLYTLNFMIEPVLKFRVGHFHPYIGAGVGASYVYGENASLNIRGTSFVPVTGTTGGSDTIAPSVAALVGAEYYVSERWALTLEYKYLAIFDPSLDYALTNYHWDTLGQHLLSAGVKVNF